MRISTLIILALCAALSGCQLLEQFDREGESIKVIDLAKECVFANSAESISSEDCATTTWVAYWSSIDSKTWPQRKQEIDSLGNTAPALFKKVLLSQGRGTPYQARLRAQAWVDDLMPLLNKEMQDFVKVAIYQPSQELLELESALVTLGKINTDQVSQMDEQQIQIEKQQNQIEQLLRIEASIMDSTKDKKQ